MRDGWYSLGKNKEGEWQLMNRAFEPKNGDVNLYTGVGRNFPIESTRAYTLTQNKSSTIDAEPLPADKHLDGTPIDQQRANSD